MHVKFVNFKFFLHNVRLNLPEKFKQFNMERDQILHLTHAHDSTGGRNKRSSNTMGLSKKVGYIGS